MTDSSFHILLICCIVLLMVLLAVSTAYVVHYRRKYHNAVMQSMKGLSIGSESRPKSPDIEITVAAERDALLDALREKAKNGIHITNDEIRHIELLEHALHTGDVDHAVSAHKRTSRTSIVQASLHLWGLGDQEIATLFDTTRQSVHNNWKRLMKNL